MSIPKDFYKKECGFPEAYCVGDLKELIELLPDDLRITAGFCQGVKLVVYNMNKQGFNPTLEFEECDD